MSMDGLVILALIVSIASCTAHWNESDNRREVDLERARIEKLRWEQGCSHPPRNSN